MKPICTKCHQFFRMKRSGYYFTEAYPVGSCRPKPGNVEPDKWRPYKIWSGDLWECQSCGASIITGVGANPISEHYKDDFRTQREWLNATQFQVNDC